MKYRMMICPKAATCKLDCRAKEPHSHVGDSGIFPKVCTEDKPLCVPVEPEGIKPTE